MTTQQKCGNIYQAEYAYKIKIGRKGREGVEQEPSGKTTTTGFEAFSGLLGVAVKNLDRLKSKGMSDYGLSGTHTLCLRQMYEAPSGLTRTELAQKVGVDRAQITRLMGDLLAKELVREIGNGSNYRKKCVLTEEGRTVTEGINDRVKRIQQFVSGDIPTERLALFYETLSEICSNLEQADDLL